MSNVVHAHKLLNVLESTPLSGQALKTHAIDTFGEGTMYRTCKLEGVSLDDILGFFVSHKKVIEVDGIWHLNKQEICDH